jgi:parallel beta-helix repeat protein
MTRLRLALAVAGVLIVSATSPAGARTWYVTADGTGDAPTIQAAIDSASDGDLIRVAPGTYDDTTHVQVGDSLEVVNVHLYKNVKLLAEGDPSNTTIGWSESDIAVYVSGVDSTAEIRGFRIETTFYPYACLDAAAAPAEPDFQFGIKCTDASLVIKDCDIVNHGVCVNLERSPARIEGSVIHLGSAGIRCYDGSDALIQSNVLYQCGGGILCDASIPEILDNSMDNICTAIYCTTDGSAHVARNLITGMRTRAISVGEAAPLIEENEFRNNTRGVYVQTSSGGPTVRSNVFRGSGYYGIWIVAATNTIIENNTIDYVPDGYAIICEGASPTIRNNIVTRAYGGVSCLTGSSPGLGCNDIFNVVDRLYTGDCSNQTGINGNISIDPQFCGVPDSGNYLLQADSPCAPGNHPDGYDCGQIGARGVGCGNTPVSKATWGSFKALFKKEESK